MSCWRVLPLSHQPDDNAIPPLLVKSVFSKDSYTVYVTDLTNIWTEELHREAIVERASSEQSPIEVSKHDTGQLAILLEHVERALLGYQDAVCRITRRSRDGLNLHTSVNLPKPLASLVWTHRLDKRTPITLKNELVLPLFMSSYIQHERIANLISIIISKDKAIGRLLDQYDSNNLDLAAAFPSVSGLKADRRTLKRKQAANHIPALQPFCEQSWSEQTWRELRGQVKDSNLAIPMNVLQEAPLYSALAVSPQELISEARSKEWWAAVPDTLTLLEPVPPKSQKPKPMPLHKTAMETSEDETEDEFGTHGHYMQAEVGTDKDESPDVPAKSQPQNQSQDRNQLRVSPCNSLDQLKAAPSIESPLKAKAEGYLVSPKAKNMPITSLSQLEHEGNIEPRVGALSSRETVLPSSRLTSPTTISPRKARKHFKIGGKGKNTSEGSSQGASTIIEKTNGDRSLPTAEPPLLVSPERLLQEESIIPEHHEETSEEKVERKRAELKQKNVEAARKQAQQLKKRKRF